MNNKAKAKKKQKQKKNKRTNLKVKGGFFEPNKQTNKKVNWPHPKGLGTQKEKEEKKKEKNKKEPFFFEEARDPNGGSGTSEKESRKCFFLDLKTRGVRGGVYGKYI